MVRLEVSLVYFQRRSRWREKRMLELVHDVWNEKSVLECWSDAILIPIPKKGDLSHCNNWRGIPLLDVIGKVVARIFQERL